MRPLRLLVFLRSEENSSEVAWPARNPSHLPIAKDSTDGSAYTTIAGKKVRLGAYGSRESRDKFARVVYEWTSQGRPAVVLSPAERQSVLVEDVIAAFWAFAKEVYPDPLMRPGKRPAGELGNYWDALRPLRRLYGTTPAVEFGPMKLKAVCDYMIRPQTIADGETGKTRERAGWCRNYANRQTNRLKRVFKWATENERVPPSVYQGLLAVTGLAVGRSPARETARVKPAPDAYVDAVLPHLSRIVQAMVRLQLLTGMRPGEVCNLRTCDVDRAGKIWVYRPPQHKTAYLGHTREIRIGPKAQEILAPFLRPTLDAYCFSPAEAEAERRDQLRLSRTTPVRS